MIKTLLLLGTLAFGQDTGILDGTEWAATLKPAGLLDFSGAKKDLLRFHEGQLSSEAGLPQGYLSTDYETSSWGRGYSWKAVQTNPKGERTFWTGIAEGDRMEGTCSRLVGSRRLRYRWTAQKSWDVRPASPP